MSDHSELKRLADEAIIFSGINGETSYAQELFAQAASPEAALALIAEVTGLHAQHGRDSAELRNLCQERDDARKERDQLKAEVEALRKDAERYRWLVLHAEEIYVEPPGSRGVNIYVDSFQAKRDSSIKESMDVEIDGLMAKASTP